MDDMGLGVLAQQDDRWTLTFTRRLAHPREKVWRAGPEGAAIGPPPGWEDHLASRA